MNKVFKKTFALLLCFFIFSVFATLTAHGQGKKALTPDEEYRYLRAAYTGDIDTVKEFIAKGTDASMALPKAAAAGNLEVVKFLVASGADVNAKTKDGTTPLMDACRASDRLEIVKVLVSSGADVNAISKKGNTPLLQAVGKSKLDVVKFLVSNGADVNVRNQSAYKGGRAYTPLTKAISYDGGLEQIKFLVSSGADVNMKDTIGQTPLLAATRVRSPDLIIIEYLVSSGADVNVKDDGGGTPLMNAAFASRGKHLEIVEYLIANGADVDARDNKGKLALPEDIRKALKEWVKSGPSQKGTP